MIDTTYTDDELAIAVVGSLSSLPGIERVQTFAPRAMDVKEVGYSQPMTKGRQMLTDVVNRCASEGAQVIENKPCEHVDYDEAQDGHVKCRTCGLEAEIQPCVVCGEYSVLVEVGDSENVIRPCDTEGCAGSQEQVCDDCRSNGPQSKCGHWK
jgi:hypothetical protein